MSSFIVRPEIGSVFYESWGYDQTNIDFAQVVAFSPTGKTVLCRMMGKKDAPAQHRGFNPSRPIMEAWENCLDHEACLVHSKHTTNTALVMPTQPYGITFRMKIDTGYQGEPAIKGSYPYVQSPEHPAESQRVHKRLGYFSKYTSPVYETPAGYGH